MTTTPARQLAWAILARAALHHVPGLASAVPDELGSVEAVADRIAGRRPPPRSRATLADLAAEDLDHAAKVGARLLTRDDPHWAALGFDDLTDADAAPVAVWVRGHGVPATAHRVGVVGARAITERGERITGEIAAALAERGWHIVSGGAYGADAAAHRAALTHDAGTTVVLANGVDRAYPYPHRELFDRIAGSGAIVSEYPLGSGPTRDRFLRRNRLVAALSHAVVVPEAGRWSGTLHTAGWARRLHRPLFAVPGPADAAASAGCHRLIQDRRAHPVTTTAALLAAIGTPSR
ncbi:DNA-processing protein DprA [Nocardia sp. NPDC049737]|uniref:DNA-processing protein DprA n=1 Tax=unclassified Nocardia TaxID=2637762 RepID=UPI003427547D